MRRTVAPSAEPVNVVNDRSSPTSVTTSFRPSAVAPPIWLSAWTAEDLEAKPGDTVTLEYFLWSDDGGLVTSIADRSTALTKTGNGILVLGSPSTAANMKGAGVKVSGGIVRWGGNDSLPADTFAVRAVTKPLSAAFRDVQFQVDVRRVQPLSLKLTRLGGSPLLEGLVRALRTIVSEER